MRCRSPAVSIAVSIAASILALVSTGCFTSTASLHVRGIEAVAVDLERDGGFAPLIAPGPESIEAAATPSIHAFRDARQGVGLLCPSCQLKTSETLVGANGWTAWLEMAESPAAGEIELRDRFCGGRGAECGGQEVRARVRVQKDAVDEIRERRSADPLPGVVALLCGVAPAIIGSIIMLAPGVQTGEEGDEYAVRRPIRFLIGVPVVALGVGLLAFGIGDLVWPDTESTTIP
jgi:hypothetical protein